MALPGGSEADWWLVCCGSEAFAEKVTQGFTALVGNLVLGTKHGNNFSHCMRIKLCWLFQPAWGSLCTMPELLHITMVI